MSDLSRPTIFALSSGRGPAAIAVVRISGPNASLALTALGIKIPEPRTARLARLRDPQSGELIDEGLALFFPGPNSETGEDIVELQLHGGRAILAATFAALGRLDGFRPAEAGEFTRRAFEAGKLDLTAVEGLADLVNAETEGQRRQAFGQMKGALGNRAESWRQQLIQALALVEARIDFSDEGDVPEGLVEPALKIARMLEAEIGQALADGRRGERLREGVVVAIAGPPNAGKSTLLNRIAQREAAIVSPYAGTTRDVIEVHLDLDGWPVTLLDTAGIRETDDPVELEGVRRARDRAAGADLVLWVEDASEGANGRPAASVQLKDNANAAQQIAGRPAAKTEEPAAKGTAKSAGEGVAAAAAAAPSLWLVRNKSDLRSSRNESLFHNTPKNEQQVQFIASTQTTDNKSGIYIPENEFDVSATTGQGMDALLAALGRQAAAFLSGTESALITRERHRSILEQTRAALSRAASLAGQEDLLAEELRTAAAALGRLIGRVDVEDILDVIFRDFCIGK